MAHEQEQTNTEAQRSRITAAIMPAMALLAVLGCTKRGPKDVGNENPRSEFADGPRATTSQADDASKARTAAKPVVAPAKGQKPREIAKASSRAIALSSSHVYFGDEEDDALYAMPKAGGEPTRLARHAPMQGALAFDAGSSFVTWIGTPGDIVLRISTQHGGASTVRDRGIFTDVVADGGDVFFSEAQGAAGSVSRVTGATAAHLASFDGSPRGITVEGQYVYIATTSNLLVTTRTRGEVKELAAGKGFGCPAIGDGWLYATAAQGPGAPHSIVRVKKGGGDLEVVVRNVRDAPIAVANKGSALYWFAADRPALLTMPIATAGGSAATDAGPRTLSEDPILEHSAALAIDDDTAFIATGFGGDARIVSVPLR